MKTEQKTRIPTIMFVTDVEDDSLERVVRLSQQRERSKDWKLKLGVRDYTDLLRLIKQEGVPDVILYYANERALDEAVKRITDEYDVVAFDIFDPVFRTIDVSIHEGLARPASGRLRADHLRKLEAIEFAGKHDDGRNIDELHLADLVIIGVSRTSKTPLSLYLANLGYKVANVPLIYGIEPPAQLFRIPKRKVVGLTISPTRLLKIRKNREARFGLKSSSYAALDAVEKEVRYAEEIMRQIGCLIIDVTQKAIEETAEEILKNLKKEEK